jgi:hypothetical protein
LTFVTRATAELPSFHGVSRKPQEVAAWPATQVRSGGGIFDTGKQAFDGENQRDRWLTYVRSTGLI